MPIIRNKTRERYTVIENAIFDAELSAEAIGVFCFLLSKPDGWIIRHAHLRAVFDCGMHRMTRILKELRRAGFLERQEIRDESTGKVKGTEYILLESPTLQFSEARKKPRFGEIKPIVNTDKNNSKYGRWGEPPKGVDETAWAEWADYKRGQPHKSTITKAANFLAGFDGNIQQDIVSESIRNGWKGLFAPKQKPHQSVSSLGPDALVAKAIELGVSTRGKTEYQLRRDVEARLSA